MKSTGSSLTPTLVAVVVVEAVVAISAEEITADEEATEATEAIVPIVAIVAIVADVVAIVADVVVSEEIAMLVLGLSTSTTKRPSLPWVKGMHCPSSPVKKQHLPTPSLSWLFRVSMYAFELLYGVSCERMRMLHVGR